MTITWAVHRLNGIVTPASASYSREELTFLLKDSGASALVTCAPLLETALQAADAAGISHDRVFLCDLPAVFQVTSREAVRMKTIEDLVQTGVRMPELPSLQWVGGQGARQTAFICYSSGTSGLPVRHI